ncbi:hypothetical protein AGOR_G00249970 [Albula goreensis]|uniref:SCP domain-containing protein n=1 Tax=Albula goreensis TaxID=1534307 RepID=A0A8T3CBM4_9TELE|nr:hypothetical protein AGOR_G00249970 [Albula goreensis]
MAFRFQVLRKGKTMTDSAFEKEFVETHNAYRAKHGAPPLTLSPGLCRSAQAWADHLLATKKMQHSRTDNGENLYYAWSSVPNDPSGKEAVDQWYSEIKDYNFRNPGFKSGTGHFTQVVWKSSKEVGVGLATDGNTVFVVGQYSPAGNVTNPGYFEKNVLPGGTSVQNDEPENPAENGKNRRADSSTTDKGFEKEFVVTHNTYRSKHGAPPLTLSRDLCRSAQAWADYLLSTRKLAHSKTDNGENLYYAWSSSPKKPSGKEAVDEWYSEISKYDFNNPGFKSGTGHFTQVVWKSSKEVGVGLATDGNTVFVVGQYSPAGNITNPGYFKENVLRADTPLQKDKLERPAENSKSHGADSNITEKELEKFTRTLIEAQNAYRKKHGAEPLKHCPALSKEAQDWAAHLVSISMLKNSEEEHGQNFWYRGTASSELPTGSEVADAWYKEIESYDFSSPGSQKGAGNFTQMVWRYSRNVGVGLASNGKGLFIAVAYYDPCGNIPKKAYYRDNVLAKKTGA